MKFFAILALLLVASHATSLYDKYPLNFSSKRSIMSVLTQVEAQLKAGGPLDAILTTLTQFEVQINEEQASHDALWASQQTECASEFEFREQEVNAADAAFKEATETLDGCTQQKTRAEADLQLTTRQLQEARGLLAGAVDMRRREAYDFETASTAYQMIVRAIDDALVILDQIWAGEASFVQLNRHINGVLKQTVAIKKAHLMGTVMNALAQLATQDVQANEALLNRVKQLFLNFKEKLSQEFNEYAAAEQAAIEEFEAEKARLESAIEQLSAQEEGLEAEISTLEKCIVTQSGIASSASSKRDRNQRIWDDAKELCAAVEVEYHTSTEARKEELELLAAISERVQQRFGELSEGVTSRGEQDADEWVYENKTEYDDSGFARADEV